jgi:hypothetical protein
MASWIARSCGPGHPAVVYLFAYRLGDAPGADTTTPHDRPLLAVLGKGRRGHHSGI